MDRKYEIETIAFIILTAFTMIFFISDKGYCSEQKKVVVYTALDQIFSEPILHEFEKQTGIKVLAVYDIEATKTTGLVNRLIAEKPNPHCDVFWNNEVMNSIILKRKKVLESYHSTNAADIPRQFKDLQGYWTGFAARARVLVANTKISNQWTEPQSIFDLQHSELKGKCAIANPLFGTTKTHVAALFTKLGETKAKVYFNDLHQNQIQVVDGNSVVKDQVGAGELTIGFTDTDDVNVGIKSGLPIKAIYPDQETIGTLIIPNTVCLVANSPHPDEGKALIDFLLSKEVEEKLAFCPSVQMPLRGDVKTPDHFVSINQIKAMDVDFEKVADQMEGAAKYVQKLFIN